MKPPARALSQPSAPPSLADERALLLQRRFFEQLALGSSLPDVLAALVEMIEAQVPGHSCSILLLDAAAGQLRHGAAPSLPPAYSALIDGTRIGPQAGSCGTAAYLDTLVVVTDIASDPRWAPWRDAALGHGLRACWSMPFHGRRGEVLGTFALYTGAPAAPSEAELEMVSHAAHLAAVAVERWRIADESGRQSRRTAALLRVASRLNAQIELGPVLEAIRDEARAALQLSACMVCFYDAAHGRFELAALDGLPPPPGSASPLPALLALHDAAWPGHECYVEDLTAGAPLDDAALRALGPRTLVSAGLTRDGELLGQLTLVSLGAARPLSEEDRALLRGIADLAAQAVTNARLFSAVQHELAARARAEEARLALERKMYEAQKLESIGVLAGGIAHDLNNLLAVIIGNVDLALLDAPPDLAMRTQLERIDLTARRGADLMRQLLAYAGRGRLVVERLDLNELVHEMTGLLETAIAKHARLRTRLTPDLPLLEADATQLRQVLMNMVINAAEAMAPATPSAAQSAGSITIATATRTLDAPDDDLPAGTYVALEVADTGHGMDQATLAKIFEPFYTTKFAGRGLGLSAVIGIVRGHGGAVRVTSALGAGTSFTILLPALAGDATRTGRSAAAPRRQARPAPARASRTALVVDDEPDVADVAARMLRWLGFETIVAHDGEAALARCRRGDPFDLVLLDLTMPQMSGEQVLRELRGAFPKMPVLLMSGYSDDAPERGAEAGGWFIQKPFSSEELRAALATAGL